MWWRFLVRISDGSPGLLFAFIFLTYAIPAIIVLRVLEYLIQ